MAVFPCTICLFFCYLNIVLISHAYMQLCILRLSTWFVYNTQSWLQSENCVSRSAVKPPLRRMISKCTVTVMPFWQMCWSRVRALLEGQQALLRFELTTFWAAAQYLKYWAKGFIHVQKLNNIGISHMSKFRKFRMTPNSEHPDWKYCLLNSVYCHLWNNNGILACIYKKPMYNTTYNKFLYIHSIL